MAEGGYGELVADLSRDLGGRLAVEVQDDDRPALAGITGRHGHADAAVGGGAGDDGSAGWRGGGNGHCVASQINSAM